MLEQFKRIKKHLGDYDQKNVDTYIAYLVKLSSEKTKDNQLKNKWFAYRNDDYLINCFKTVANDGLIFDGVKITLNPNGISYNYQAYKDKMLLVYPESKVDLALVYKDDVFSFSKNSGKVFYSHEIVNPFSRKDEDIIGGFCVIKNRRGESITSLSNEDFTKHRKVARTDYIWKSWYPEMCTKTLIKKACKEYYNDIFANIIVKDNENNDIDLPVDVPLTVKQEIENLNTLEELMTYYNDNIKKHSKDSKGFLNLLSKRKAEIKGATDENN